MHEPITTVFRASSFSAFDIVADVPCASLGRFGTSQGNQFGFFLASKIRRKAAAPAAHETREAADKLALSTGLGAERCAEAVARILSVMGRREDLRGGTSDRAFLAFKLHRFISGAGQVYSTLEPATSRRVVLEGQVFHPDDETARLYPTFFCRECGQEHHSVSIELALHNPQCSYQTLMNTTMVAISDVRCRCGAEYERAESSTFVRSTKAESYRCEVCGSSWRWTIRQPSFYRLIAQPEVPLARTEVSSVGRQRCPTFTWLQSAFGTIVAPLQTPGWLKSWPDLDETVADFRSAVPVVNANAPKAASVGSMMTLDTNVGAKFAKHISKADLLRVAELIGRCDPVHLTTTFGRFQIEKLALA